VKRKLDVLREHCDREGRDYDEIQKTVNFPFDVGNGAHVNEIVDQLGELAAMGFAVAHGRVAGVDRIEPIEIIGREIIPAVANL
jgi:hypothetical protein